MPWIENADRHGRRGRQREQLLIAGGGFPIIDEDADPNTALRCLQERFGNQAPGFITVEDVVLKIKGTLGPRDEL
jgi:hypothetical protein